MPTMSDVCLGSTGPSAFFVPPCETPVAVYTAIVGALTLIRFALFVNTSVFWLKRRARQLRFSWHNGDMAKLHKARRRLPVMPAVLFLETLVFIGFLGVPFWIADPQQRDSTMLALMGVLSITFYLTSVMAINHYVQLGERLIGVALPVVPGSTQEQARAFEILASVDALLRGVYSLILLLIAASATAALPVNLASANPYDVAFPFFYGTSAVMGFLVLVAIEHQLYRITVAVASAQAGPGDSKVKAIYGPVLQRLRLQRVGIFLLASPAPLIYLLSAVNVISSAYL